VYGGRPCCSSLTGTSTSTPTTVASAAGLEAEQADRGGNRELEEVAGADQGGGRRDAVRDAELAAEQIGES